MSLLQESCVMFILNSLNKSPVSWYIPRLFKTGHMNVCVHCWSTVLIQTVWTKMEILLSTTLCLKIIRHWLSACLNTVQTWNKKTRYSSSHCNFQIIWNMCVCVLKVIEVGLTLHVKNKGIIKWKYSDIACLFTNMTSCRDALKEALEYRIFLHWRLAYWCFALR